MILLDHRETRQRMSRRIRALFVLLRYAAYRERRPSEGLVGGNATVDVLTSTAKAHS